MTQIDWISDSALSDYGHAAAIDAISRTLESGFDPSSDKVRSFVEFSQGQGLVMPSEIGDYVGLKFVTVAPGNPSNNLDRIQGIFTLFDSRSLTPLAQFNGAALTLLRTAAVSGAVISRLTEATEPKVALFGSGPQALAHILSIEVIANLKSVAVFARNSATSDTLLQTVRETGVSCHLGGREDLLEADIIITATTARDPLFTLDEINPNALIVAVGSHEASAREIGSEIVGAAQVFVEDVSTCLREAGDVIMAIQDGAISEAELVPMSSLFRNEPASKLRHGSEAGLKLYKSTGMPWQDLAIFSDIYEKRGFLATG